MKDSTAQDLLWEYAQRRRAVDAEFSDDLESALRTAGYVGSAPMSEERAREVACLAGILDAWEAWPGEGEGYGDAAQEAMMAVHEALRRASYISAFEVAPAGQILRDAARGGDAPADLPLQDRILQERISQAIEACEANLRAGEDAAPFARQRAEKALQDVHAAIYGAALARRGAVDTPTPEPATLTREEARCPSRYHGIACEKYGPHDTHGTLDGLNMWLGYAAGATTEDATGGAK